MIADDDVHLLEGTIRAFTLILTYALSTGRSGEAKQKAFCMPAIGLHKKSDILVQGEVLV